ncbi:hypothetical protein A2U01_0010845 [Trifolium medium]|uniref:Uncharacterized protein n=1 Tax=Trifolium medium TaxID=97028 RepID=A0A392MR79_9FABA|nr:hypothetical protein [Trifolium medium]
MEIFAVKKNTHLAAVYYNQKPNLFRIHIDVTMDDLKHQLSQLNNRLNCRDARRVTDVEYHRSSVCTNRSVLFTNMKFQNDGDVSSLSTVRRDQLS